MNICDHTHIKINNGDILTVRGFEKNEENFFAVPLYFLSESYDRSLDGVGYEKFIDEFAERYQATNPESIKNTPYGLRIQISKIQISQAFDPFQKFFYIYNALKKPIYKRVVDVLSNIIPKVDIGFIGSSLVGFSTSNSDLDVIVRGLSNYKTVRREFRSYLLELGAKSAIPAKQFQKSIKKYEHLFNRENNDFRLMILNRWPTVYIPNEIFCKIRFTYNPLKDRVFYAPYDITPVDKILKGKVVCDAGSAFMPRHFILETKKGERYKVITYFWDYSYCVSNGDEVVITGIIDKEKKIGIISNRRKHGIKFNKHTKVFCPLC